MPRTIKAYSYGCLMAMLPESVASRVRGFAALIPDEDIYQDEKGEKGREDSPHITVKYGLHTGDGALVASIMASRRAAYAKLGRMSVFENNECVVLKIDVDSPDLHALNKFVDSVFDTTSGFPVYHPHVTVAYLRKGCDWRKYVCDLFQGIEIDFDTLLFSSADDVETAVTLQEQSKVARIARKVASDWLIRNNVTDNYPDHKTEMQVKIQIAYDGENEHRAQQDFMDKLAGLGAHKVQIIMGAADQNGIGVN